MLRKFLLMGTIIAQRRPASTRDRLLPIPQGRYKATEHSKAKGRGVAVSSMTGFARVEGQIDGFAWVWELKSVNGKALDLRFRLPTGYDALEAPCKTLLGDRLKRGSINATLSISEAARAAQLKINETTLAQVVELLRSLEGVIDAAPPRLDGLLAIRGVMELVED